MDVITANLMKIRNQLKKPSFGAANCLVSK